MRNKSILCAFVVFAMVLAGCKGMASKRDTEGAVDPISRLAAK